MGDLGIEFKKLENIIKMDSMSVYIILRLLENG